MWELDIVGTIENRVYVDIESAFNNVKISLIWKALNNLIRYQQTILKDKVIKPSIGIANSSKVVTTGASSRRCDFSTSVEFGRRVNRL